MGRKVRLVQYTKTVDDTVSIPLREGNGILRYSVSVDRKGKLARYSFAYINFRLCSTDNGRVLGYDNCHGYHHRHILGREEKIEFISYEEIETRFKKEWRAYHERAKDIH